MKHTSNGSKGGDSRRPVELPSFILTFSLPKSQPVALIKKKRDRETEGGRIGKTCRVFTKRKHTWGTKANFLWVPSCSFLCILARRCCPLPSPHLYVFFILFPFRRSVKCVLPSALKSSFSFADTLSLSLSPTRSPSRALSLFSLSFLLCYT